MKARISNGRPIAAAQRLLPGYGLLLASMVVLTSGFAQALTSPTLVQDIRPGSEGSYPQNFLPLGNKVFFVANNGVNGNEPWVSDGTTAGTMILQDVWAGAGSGFNVGCPSCNAIGAGSVVYFSAYNGTGGSRLWRTDGTTAGTSLVYADATAFDLEKVGGTIYFGGSPSGFSQGFLFTSDGTPGGTAQVTSNVYYGSGLTDVGGTAFFMGATGSTGDELWKSNGTEGTTGMIKDMSPGSSSSYLWFLTNVGGTLFAYGSAGPDAGLFKSDGTSAGTFLLKSLQMGASQFETGQILDVNGTAFLIASDGTTGMELWKSDGTIGGTVLVKDILPGAGGALLGSRLVAIGGTVYFAATDGVVGMELWKSDGTAAGTVLVKDIFLGSGNFGSSNPAGLAAVNGKLLFRAQATVPGGTQPWMSDGTEAGTTQIAVMNPDPGGNCAAESFMLAGSNVLFSGTSSSTSDIELWVMSDAPVGVSPSDASASPSIALSQNYPNPVRTDTQIAYSIPAGQHVVLKLYDVSGREVKTLVNSMQSAGTHRVDLNAADLPSGAYVYRLQTGSVVEQKKMMLIH